MQYFTEEALKKSDFPFDTALSGGAAFAPQQEERVHNHDCLEIVQIAAEGGYMIYNRQKHLLHRGDVWIINNQDYHMSYNTDGLLIRVIVFHTDLVWNASGTDHEYLKAFFDRRKDIAPILPAETVAACGIDTSISILVREWQEKLPGYRVMIRAELLKMLGLIYRCCEKSALFSPAYTHSWHNYHLLLPVLDHIGRNPQQNLSLKEAASMAHMSESHFSAEFRKVTQLPFSKYLLEKRLQLACSLLATTQLPVTEIALQCGFNTISYFNRAFKNRFVLSPGVYRTQQQKTD